METQILPNAYETGYEFEKSHRTECPKVVGTATRMAVALILEQK